MISEKRTQEWERNWPSESQVPPDPPLTEAQAIELAQKGDSAGFERIYRLHSKRVYGLCLRMMSNASEAEDMTQEVFLQVFRKIHTFRSDSLLSTWLYRVTFNAILMQLRKRNLLELYPQTLDGEQNAPLDPGVHRGFAPVKGHLDRLHLERAVSQLPANWRMVFVLHDVQGFKHQEIARMLRCSTNTSKGHLHRAHLRLRQLLARGPRRHHTPAPAALPN